jgi:hypothetical protein
VPVHYTKTTFETTPAFLLRRSLAGIVLEQCYN